MLDFRKDFHADFIIEVDRQVPSIFKLMAIKTITGSVSRFNKTFFSFWDVFRGHLNMF